MNSQPGPLTIKQWLETAGRELSEIGISSARLDAELILAHTIRRNRTYIHAHGEEIIDSRFVDILNTRLALRLDRVPVAYIIGHKEFYGRPFKVTPSTLIPRPESEIMIDLLREAMTQPELPLVATALKLVDVGTGSGCLGITANLEFPELEVTLIDNERHALSIAEANAERLGANVKIMKSDLLSGYPFSTDFVLANLPYVDEIWQVSPETRHEPPGALYATDGGLSLINRLLSELPSRLNSRGTVLIEADPRQHEAIIKKATDYGLAHKASKGFIIWLQAS